MKTLFIALLLAGSFNAFGEESGCDEGGYTSEGESCERVAQDNEWDHSQAEFDKPNP